MKATIMTEDGKWAHYGIVWRFGTWLKDAGESLRIAWLKRLGYRIRGHVA